MNLNICTGLDSLLFLFKKRDRATIIADIIKSVKYKPRGKKKTHIMQSANLSYDQINKYLDLLMRNGLIIFDGGVYRSTTRGLEFLETIEADYLKLRTRI